MGVTWYSETKIFTTEPEKIKQLIDRVKNNEEYTTIEDLEITNNVVSLNSGAYGYFGIRMPWDEEEMPLLFEYLFNNYSGPLICHETVESCQGEDYCFSTSWTKHEGEIDWENDEDETFSIYTSIIAKSISDLDDDFSAILVWSTYIGNPWITPALKKLIETAKERGFSEWANEDELGEFFNCDESITFNTIEKIEKYLNDAGELIDEALIDANQLMIDCCRFIYSNIDYPAELTHLIDQHNSNIETQIFFN